MRRTGFVCVVVALVAACAGGAEGGSEPDAVLKAAAGALRSALGELGAAVSFEYPEHLALLYVRYRTRTFLVHGSSKRGEYTKEASEQEGPRYNGFLLRVHLQEAGAAHQARVPQTIREPYWQTDLDVTVVPGTGKQLYWALSYGSVSDRHVLGEIRAALRGLGRAVGGRSTLQVASLMLVPVKWDKAANKVRLEAAIREAKGKGAELIVTPEGALEGYVVNEVIRATGAERQVLTEKFNALAEPVGGPYIKHFRRLCKESSIYLILGFLEADGGKTYNTAVLIGPDGKVAGKYRKTHFAQGYGNGDEKGDNPPGYLRGTEYPVFEVGGRKMGIMICFDRRKPIVARRLVENGAEFIINPAFGMMGDCNCEFLSGRGKETGAPILFVHPEQTVYSDEHGEIKLDLRPKVDEARVAIVPIEIP